MRWIPLAAVLIASPAVAAPTYLSCTVPTASGEAIYIDVAADADAREVVATFPKSGDSERYPAAFSATSVGFSDTGSVNFAIDYKISRVDLTIERTITMSGKRETSQGTCKVQKAPARAF